MGMVLLVFLLCKCYTARCLGEAISIEWGHRRSSIPLAERRHQSVYQLRNKDNEFIFSIPPHIDFELQQAQHFKSQGSWGADRRKQVVRLRSTQANQPAMIPHFNSRVIYLNAYCYTTSISAPTRLISLHVFEISFCFMVQFQNHTRCKAPVHYSPFSYL